MSVLNAFLGKVVTQIINPIIMLLAAGAFVYFLWGVVKFIRAAGDDTRRKEAQDGILWGIVGLVVIFGAYGIINVAANTFGLQSISKISTQTSAPSATPGQ